MKEPTNRSHPIAIRYGVATRSRLLKIIGLFAKQPYKRDDILQKRPIILRRLLLVATPYLMKDCTGARKGECAHSQNNFSHVEQRRRPTLLQHPVPAPHTSMLHIGIHHVTRNRHRYRHRHRDRHRRSVCTDIDTEIDTDGSEHTYVTHWNTSRHLQYVTSQCHVTYP